MLTIDVYRNGACLTDCTRNGVSARFNTLYVANVEGPANPPKDAQNVVVLQNHCTGCLRLVPAHWDDEANRWVADKSVWYMAGGNYGGTSDSRFSERCANLLQLFTYYGLVAIHDRVE